MLVLNAGVFPGGKKIAALPDDEWRKVMAVNLDSNLSIMREAHPLLKAAPRHGRVVVNGSKNVRHRAGRSGLFRVQGGADPGRPRRRAGVGGDGIRVNVVHPNAVFDTASGRRRCWRSAQRITA